MMEWTQYLPNRLHSKPDRLSVILLLLMLSRLDHLFTPTMVSASHCVTSNARRINGFLHRFKNYDLDLGAVVADLREDTSQCAGRSWCNATVVLELERRVIQSRYLLRAMEAGGLPPQETGLVVSTYYGKFHLEMVSPFLPPCSS